MYLQFTTHPEFNFLTSFSEKFDVPVVNDRITIPESMGKGSIRKIELDPEFKLIVHQYNLKEDFILQRIAPTVSHDLVSIIFNSNEEPVSLTTPADQIQFSKFTDFAIQIASADLDSEIRFPANTEISFTVLGIRIPTLSTLLPIKKPNRVVQTILNGQSGFLYYESMGIEVQKVLKQLTDFNQENELSFLYYKIKAQELLYLVFEKLLQRENTRHSQIYKDDIEKLLLIRTQIIADLSQPPRLQLLSKTAGMGETKMKELFKQVFGDSIYNYFQKARMEEAAYLLKQGKYTVTQIGYKLGFLNLSHFSKLFEKHYGSKPKKYSSVG